MSIVALSVIARFGRLPEGAGTPNDGTSALQCVVPDVVQPSAHVVVLAIVPPLLQTTSVSPLQLVVFGVHVLQTPPWQPAAMQSFGWAGCPFAPHVIAIDPEQ